MSKKPSQQELENQVGIVKEIKESVPDKVTIEGLRQKWKDVFGKYGQKTTFENIIGAWNTGVSLIDNPYVQNSRVKSINTHPRNFDKEKLENILGDPENHEDEIRAISWQMYYTQYIYQTIVRLNSIVPNYHTYFYPLYIEDGSNKNIKDDSIMVDKIIKTINPKLTFKTIANQVSVEGKCTYLIRESHDKKKVNYVVFQKLNPDMVKITGLGSKNRFITSFNMAIFLNAGYDVSQYPKFIQDTWQEMLNNETVIIDKKGKQRINPKANLPSEVILESTGKGNWMYWVKLPQDLAYTFYEDGAHVNAFPSTIGLLEPFDTLSDYQWLQGNLASRGVTNILTGEVPLAYQPKAGADMTALSTDVILGFTDMFNNLVSDRVAGFFAPFNDYELHTLDSDPSAMNIVSERIKQLVASSGQTGLITLSDSPSIISVKTARLLQAAKSDYLTRQFEDCLNEIVNNCFDLKLSWRIKLHGDIFTDEDQIKITKELVLNGATALLPKLLSFEDLTLEDYKGCEAYLNKLGVKLEDRKYEEETSVGRPALSEDDIENDNTGDSVNGGDNISDIK